MQRVLPLLFAVSLIPANVQAQDWAAKMFNATSHDFGTVARGAETRYVFTITNLYKETVHIVTVAKSCGCTGASYDHDTLRTHEQAHLVVEMDTLKFVDRKSSTVTVTFDQPFYAEVKLPISAYIRRDVVLTPGHATFGTVAQGESTARKIDVKYAGRPDWQIDAVRSSGKYVEAKLVETRRDSGRVSYEVLLQLKPDAPAGYFREQLTLITNDAGTAELPLIAEGKVEPPITVNPQTVSFGVVHPGQTVTRQIVVRGREPFTIVGIKAASDEQNVAFSVNPPETKSALHLVPITFKAPETPGNVKQEFLIETDLPNAPVLEFSTHSQVVE